MILNEPQIRVAGGEYVLEGVEAGSLPLWNVHERNESCRENIKKALETDAKVTPVFVGGDHLQFLKDSWPESRPAIVIEKSRLFRDCLDREGCLPVSGSNIRFVVGQFGVCTPRYSTEYIINYYYQELGYLAFQLFLLPDGLWERYEIHLLPPADLEREFLWLLAQVVYVVWSAKDFHRRHEERYRRFRESDARRHGNCLLVRHQEHVRELERNFGDMVRREDFTHFLIGDHGEWYNYMSLFGKLKNYPRSSSFLTHDSVRCYEEKAEELLDHLEKVRPARLLSKNRSALATLEDVFFSEEMVRRLRIPNYSFLMDWLTPMSHMMEGGWSFHLSLDLWPAVDKRLLSNEPSNTRLFAPKDHDVCWYPYRYFYDDHTLKAPLASPSDMERDVAIVNNVRYGRYADAILHDIYSLIVLLSPDEPSRATLNFIYLMHQYMNETAGLEGAYFWKSMLSIMEWQFYHKTRVARVLEVASKMPHLRWQVFGDNWNDLVPAQNYGGDLKQEDVLRVYRTSAVTIDMSISSCYQYPHPNIIDCFGAGGFCLAYPPCFDFQAEGVEDVIPRALIPYCDGADDFIRKAEYYRTHWEERNHAIRVLQEGWLSKLQSNHFHQGTLEDLLKKTVPHPRQLPGTVTGDANRDFFLLKAASGYLYLGCGFPKTALEVWRDAFETFGIRNEIVARKAVAVARDIGDASLERYFAAF